MSDAPPPFDSAQPFETMTAPAFDPSKPFSPFKAAEPEEELKLPPAITDIPHEIAGEAKAGASDVAGVMNRGKMGTVEALTSIPKAILGAGRVLASPVTGAISSVGGHALANVERGFGEHVVNPLMEHFGYKAQHPDEAEMYETAKGDVNKAMMGARPYGATIKPPGLMTYEPKLLEPPGTPLREPTPPPAPEPPMQEPPRQTLRPDAGVDLLPSDVPHTPRSDVRIRSLSAAGPGGPLSDISPETQTYLRKIMQDQGLNQNTLDDRLADMSAHHFFGEITPSLESDMGAIAAPPGPGKQEVLGSIRQRGAEKLERLQNTFDRAFGQNENVAQLSRLIDIDKQKAASPIYQQFRQTTIPPSPEVDAILPRLRASGSLQAANKALAEEGLPASQGFVEGPAANAFDEGTQVKRVPTAAAFDYAKQHLDGLINSALKNEDAGAVRRYTKMKNDLDAALDAHPTAGKLWQQAREAYGGPTARQDAMKFGQRVLTNHVGADELPFLTAGYNDAQMQALRVGMRKYLEDKLGSRREVSADIFTSTLSPNNIQKIRWAIGDQAADELVTGMHHELHMHGAPTRIHGGSPTAHRLEAQKRWTVQPAEEGLTSDLGIKDAFHPGKTAARKAVEVVTKMGQAKKLAAAEAKAAKLREEAARVFTLQGPERDAAARHLLGGVGGTPRARGGRVSTKLTAKARASGGAVQRAIRASKGYAEGGAPDLSDDDQAAMMPETFANPYLKQTLASSLQASPPRDENVRFRTASPLVNITDEDIDRGVNIGMASGPGSIKGVGPIRAYHGSPHDFDKFDLSKIGTGEGAQAYGHGLYFADNEGVAKSYRDALSGKNMTLDGAAYNTNDPLHNAAAVLDKFNGDRDAALKWLDGSRIMAPTYETLKSGVDLPKVNRPGHMYEVNINADPSHFLDWDRPLSQQGEGVKKFVGPPSTMFPENMTGSELYNMLGRGNERGVSDSLREAGIPGIKYLDQGSRGAGEGSSNYVVFNHDLINIVRKYALAGIALPPAIAAAYDKMQQNGRASGGAVSRAVRAAKGYETGGAPDYDPFAAETFLHPALAGLSAQTAQKDVGRLRALASMEPSDRSEENVRFKTASPLANITDEDIDRGMNVAMAAGPGKIEKPGVGLIKRSTEIPNIRELPAAEAIEVARKQPHLIKAGDQSEGYFVGGPREIQSKRGLTNLRNRFDDYVAADPRGGNWYDRYRNSIAEVTGNDPLQNKWMANQEGQWSAGVSPEGELGFALKENNASLAGMPVKSARPAQHIAHERAIEAQDPGRYQLGDKTGEYASLINPDRPRPAGATGVNDFRHARNFDYTEAAGGSQRDALTAAQHKFLDYETALAVDRANKANLGGRSNWTGEQLQAAPWVRQKALDLMSRNEKLSYDDAFARANTTIGDFFDKHTAFATHEAMPGADTGHLSGSIGAPSAEREAFAADPRSTWATAPGGRDAIYGGMAIEGTGNAMRVRPTTEMQGLYTPPVGPQKPIPAGRQGRWSRLMRGRPRR